MPSALCNKIGSVRGPVGAGALSVGVFVLVGHNDVPAAQACCGAVARACVQTDVFTLPAAIAAAAAGFVCRAGKPA